MRHVILLVFCSFLIVGCSTPTKYYYNKKYLPNVQQRVYDRDILECKKYAEKKIQVPDYDYIPVPITYNYESTTLISGNTVITNSTEFLSISPIGAFVAAVNLAMVAHQYSANQEYEKFCLECLKEFGWIEITKDEYLQPSPPDPPNGKVERILNYFRSKGYSQLKWNISNLTYFLLAENSIQKYDDLLVLKIVEVPFSGNGSFKENRYVVDVKRKKFKLSGMVLDDEELKSNYEKDSILSQYIQGIENRRTSYLINENKGEIFEKIERLRKEGYSQIIFGDDIKTYFLIDPKSIKENNQKILFKMVELNELTLIEKEFFYIVNPNEMTFIAFSDTKDSCYPNCLPNRKFTTGSVIDTYIKLIKSKKL